MHSLRSHHPLILNHDLRCGVHFWPLRIIKNPETQKQLAVCHLPRSRAHPKPAMAGTVHRDLRFLKLFWACMQTLHFWFATVALRFGSAPHSPYLWCTSWGALGLWYFYLTLLLLLFIIQVFEESCTSSSLVEYDWVHWTNSTENIEEFCWSCPGFFFHFFYTKRSSLEWWRVLHPWEWMKHPKYGWKVNYSSKYMQFIQEWAIPSLNFMVIEWFHQLKRAESIAKYSLKFFCLAIKQNIAQKKTLIMSMWNYKYALDMALMYRGCYMLYLVQ
jgi:hypothetical protein